jgi:hypothetical protein
VRPIQELVRTTIAAHLRLDPEVIQSDSRLSDLHLKPVDLAWVAVRVETLARGGQFPVERLADAVTVRDITNAFESWIR